MSHESTNSGRSGLGLLPIEPLSDLGWQRIERRLFAGGAVQAEEVGGDGATRPGTARRRGRAWLGRRRLVGGLAGAAAVAAAVLALLLWPRAAGRGAGAGLDKVAAPDSRGQTGTRPPSRIVTADAPSAVSVGDVALDVAARSAVLVDGDRDGGVMIVLERGEVSCRVAPRAGRPPVVVHAGDVRIEVVGTAFAVAREGDSARVVVYEGVVAAVQGGRLTRVAAGQTWSGASSAAGAAPTPAALPAPRESEPERPRARGERGRGERGDRGRGKRGQRSPGGRRAGPQAGVHDSASAEPADAAPRTEGGAAGTAHPATPSDRARYEQAAGLERSDASAALAIYDQLVRGGGRWAANALYAQGRLEFELRHPERARRLLESYLSHYPHGPNADDATQLLTQLR